MRSYAWRSRATSCTSSAGGEIAGRRAEKSTHSIAAISCSSGANRRRSTQPLTSTVARTATTSSPSRRRSATAFGSRCTVTVAERGGGDQQRVDGEDLGEETGALHASAVIGTPGGPM